MLDYIKEGLQYAWEGVVPIEYKQEIYSAGLTKPGEVGNLFALISMKSPNFCQNAKF